MMIALPVPFCLAGLAVLHAAARRLSAAGDGCWCTFYMRGGVFGWPFLVVAVLGLLEIWLGLRRRLAPLSIQRNLMVDLILLERVEKLGQMGQVVKVKPGFARNYLLPQKKAMRATKENLAYFETQRAQLEANNLQRKSEAAEVGDKMEGVTVVLIRQAGESGQLYGSVSARDIAEAVTAGGLHGRQAADRARPADQDAWACIRSGHAASRGRGHRDRQCRAVRRRGANAGRRHRPAASAAKRRTTRDDPKPPRRDLRSTRTNKFIESLIRSREFER